MTSDVAEKHSADPAPTLQLCGGVDDRPRASAAVGARWRLRAALAADALDPDSQIAFSRRFGACRRWRSLLG